ncbi:divalent-cation tolerance protein CutA [Streptomyces sp. NPDC006879]|uniref:divalent-cation tolerance protein CutA n=1 Tax=Streptomyces sp. NPDC006879 TaxID=3364767 RepID=UPI0036A7A1E7
MPAAAPGARLVRQHPTKAKESAVTPDEQTVLAVTTTVDSTDAARHLAAGAVEARYAACAQITGPVTSVYRWRGAVETAQEWQVTFKTVAARYPDLEAHLLAAHPYDTPEILAAHVVHGSADYLEWVAAETARNS